MKGETSLNKLICLFCSTLNECFCALSCFVCFGLPNLFSPLHHIKETIWQLHNMPKHYTVKWTDTCACEGDRSSSNAISISDV